MKKYIFLFAATAIIIGGILSIAIQAEKSIVQVDTYEVRAQSVEETVVCSGKVETAKTRSVMLNVPCVPDQVLVSEGDSVKKGDVLFTVDFDATKAALATAGMGVQNVDIDKYLDKEYTSPVTGVVSQVNVKEGQPASYTVPCVNISSSEELQIKVCISENNLRSVRVGQKVQVQGKAFQKDSYPGTITEIAPVARQQLVGANMETVVDAVVTLDRKNIDESLKIGLNADATIVVSSRPQGIVVPYAYVSQDDENREFVYVIRGNRAAKQFVTTGKELPAGLEILDGLGDGATIVRNVQDIPSRDSETVLKVRSGKG